MTIPVLPEEDDPACDCGRENPVDIQWFPLSRQYLCYLCRNDATDAEFRMTLEQKRALDAQAKEAS